MPNNRAEEGLDIHQLLLKHDSANLLIDCNTAAVIQGGDGLTLHFGAHSAHEISEAKKKMDKLLQYHVCILLFLGAFTTILTVYSAWDTNWASIVCLS